jgi:hypothetical protein
VDTPLGTGGGEDLVVAIGSSRRGDTSEGDLGKRLPLGKEKLPLGLSLADGSARSLATANLAHIDFYRLCATLRHLYYEANSPHRRPLGRS